MPLPQSAELFYGLKLTDEQKVYADSIVDNLVTFVQARAGSGKTTIPVGTALAMRKELHYIFPTVEEGALGYSTGDVKQKESKYLTPLLDAIVSIGENPSQAIIGEPTKWGKQDTGWIHAYSHNYMRGGNLKDCIVLIDEAQNLTKRELRKILTRCHDTCHVIVAGDINQCDIKDAMSGFLPYLTHYEKTTFTLVCELTKNFRGVISGHAETI
jgi:phosphate starvation-inducible PhoH-like protein